MVKVFLWTFVLLGILTLGNSTSIVGAGHETFLINNVETTLTFAEISVSAAKDVLSFVDAEAEGGKRDYSFGPTWVAFDIADADIYLQKKYDVQGVCSCGEVSCNACNGILNITCQSNNSQTGFWHELGCAATKYNLAVIAGEHLADDYLVDHLNYCWAFRPSENPKQYIKRTINHLWAISFTSYGGPKSGLASPGYTIREMQDGITYGYNALISKKVEKKKMDLSEYYYADTESGSRLVLKTDIENLAKQPELSFFNVTFRGCFQDGQADLRHSEYNGPKLTAQADRSQFKLFTILKNATVQKRTELTDLHILGIDGLKEWHPQSDFDFVDPCNRQFLTLQSKQDGFFVIPPPGQTVDSNLICIAVSENHGTTDELVLYQTKNGSKEWEASSMWRGGLSNDMLATVELKITTKSSLPFSFKEGQLKFEVIDAKPPGLKITTPYGVSCEFAMTKNCTFPLKTTDQNPTGQILVPEKCGYWQQGIPYSCEGLHGTYPPPTKFTDMSLDKVYQPAHEELPNVRLPNPPDNDRGWLKGIWDWFKNFTLDNLWSTLKSWLVRLIEFVIILVVLYLLYLLLSYLLVSGCKSLWAGMLKARAINKAQKSYEQVNQDPEVEMVDRRVTRKKTSK